MVDFIDEKEFIKQNNIRVNKRIAYIFISSLVLGPLLAVGKYFDLFYLSYEFCLFTFIGSAMLNLVYHVLTKEVRYHNIARYFAMFLLEIFIVILSASKGVGIYITYGLVPLMSCIYYDVKFSRNICIGCYFAMMIGLYFRSYYDYQMFNDVNPDFTRLTWFACFGLGYTIEYMFVSITVVIVSKYAKTFFDSLYIKNIENIKTKSEAKAKDDFFASMSHEIRTPINAILGLDEMILRESNDEKILDYGYNIQSASQTLLNIVNDILDISKIDSGKMKIINVSYDLGELINTEINMIKCRADKKGLELKVEIGKDVPSKIYGDEGRIKQIVTNIMTNAVKYTKKGYIKIRVGARPISVEEASKYKIYSDKIQKYIILWVEVEDTGVGIKDDEINKLFSAFQRLEEEKNRSIEGTGLGMAIVSNLLKLMDGKIHIDSIYGEGSNFIVEIPQGIIDGKPISEYEVICENKNSKVKDERRFIAPDANILVVDDNSMNRIVIKSLLERLEVRLTTVSSGLECLELIKTEKYDIILLDYMMPIMDGVETFYKMKEQEENMSRDSHVIVLTANAIDGAKEKYLSIGFEDYLSKPVTPRVLEDTIEKYLPKEKIIKEVENKKDKIELFTISNDVINNVGGIVTYKKIVNNFYLSIDSKVQLINECYEQINVPEKLNRYITEVHALKSSAKTIGLFKLSNLAEKIEKYGHDNDIENIKQYHNKLINMQLRAKEKISSYIEKSVEEKEIKISNKNLINKLTCLREAINDMDIDLCDEIMAEIDRGKIDNRITDEINKLKGYIINIDLASINITVEEVIKKVS